jgi:VanZ family protein
MIAFVMGYGVTTEVLQLFVPHRTSRVMDGIENILGIALGSAVYWLLLRLSGKLDEDRGADPAADT